MKTTKITKSNKSSISKGQALFLLLAGLFMGTIFTFGMHYWNAPVERANAIQKEAAFDYYKEDFSKHNTRGISVYFIDCEQLYIDGECVNDQLRKDLADISAGTKVELMIHPNSDTILDMRVQNQVILDFDDVQEKLSGENKIFFVLGILCYAIALGGLWQLIPKKQI